MSLYDSSLLFFALAAIGITITGISKSGFAGGSGVVAVPLLATIMPIHHAVILVLPLLIIMDIKTIQYFRKSVAWGDVLKVIPAAIIGIIIGSFMLGAIDPNALQLWFGLLCILFASWQKLAPLLGKMKGGAYLWGCISGITSTLIHSGAPPFNIYMIARGLPKQTWLAIAGVFFFVMNCLKIIPYYLIGDWSLSLLWTSVIFIPFALFGTYLGKIMQGKISEKTFMQLCRAFLALSGALLIYKGLV